MKILWYENMKKDLNSVIKDVAKFLGFDLTESEVMKLDDHLYIDNFRKVFTESYGGDEIMKNFIRRGQVGDWKEYFDETNANIWDAWISSNLDDTGIELPVVE